MGVGSTGSHCHALAMNEGSRQMPDQWMRSVTVVGTGHGNVVGIW